MAGEPPRPPPPSGRPLPPRRCRCRRLPRPSGGLGQAALPPSGPEPRWPASLAAYLRCLGPAKLGKGRPVPRRVNRRTPPPDYFCLISAGMRQPRRLAGGGGGGGVGRGPSGSLKGPPPHSARVEVRAQQDSEGRVEEKKKKKRQKRERKSKRERERVRGAAEPTPMAADEVAGGARKATKSKLFEFLVHGVVSGVLAGEGERAGSG